MSFYEDIEDDHYEHDDDHDLDQDDNEETKPIKKTNDDVNEDDEEVEDEYELEYGHDDDIDDILEENDDDEEETEKSYIEDNINFNENELDNESSFEYIVPANERLTSNTLTEFEFTELISVRGQQISQGSYVFVSDIEGINDPIEIAKKELLSNKSPLYVKRYIGRTKNMEKFELWNPNEMNKPKS